MITTKTGDKGQTTCGNKKIDKDSLLVNLVGEIDELQAVMGIVRCKFVGDNLKDPLQLVIENIQKDLMKINGELACEMKFVEIEKKINGFEKEIEKMEGELPELKEFLIPGVNETEAYLNLARTVCRRIERGAVKLNREKPINSSVLVYLNRLSDYLFLIMRKAGN